VADAKTFLIALSAVIAANAVAVAAVMICRWLKDKFKLRKNQRPDDAIAQNSIIGWVVTLLLHFQPEDY